MKYSSKEQAQQDHLDNYRSNGVKKGKGSMYASDQTRVQFLLDNTVKQGYVLDVGVNAGTVAIPLMQLGCKVKGIDLVPELVEEAKKNGVFAEVGEAEDLSTHRDNTYDTVICAEVLEHLYDPLPAIEEAYRVLKKDGVYLVTIPHTESFMCEDRLGDYHQQNFSLEILDTLFHLKFKRGKVDIFSIPYNEHYCKANGLDPKRPQWWGIRAQK